MTRFKAGLLLLIASLAAGPAASQEFAGEAEAGIGRLGADARALGARHDASAQELRAMAGAAQAPKSLGSETFEGRLFIEGGRLLKLNGLGGAVMPLWNGPVTLKYGLPSWSSVFGGERSVSLTAGGLTAVWEAKRSEFSSFGDFKTADGAGQPVRLRGKQEVTETGRSETTERVSCTHTSYCYTCAPGFDMKLECKFKLSPNCSGSQQALVRVTSFRKVVTVELQSKEGERLATVTGSPELSNKKERLQTLTSCQ